MCCPAQPVDARCKIREECPERWNMRLSQRLKSIWQREFKVIYYVLFNKDLVCGVRDRTSVAASQPVGAESCDTVL